MAHYGRHVGTQQLTIAYRWHWLWLARAWVRVMRVLSLVVGNDRSRDWATRGMRRLVRVELVK